MEKKRRIEVLINGQSHFFVTSESEEYIKGLADYLNEKISEVTGTSFGNLLPNDKKYIVTAMNILDDYYKILSKYEELREKGNSEEGQRQSAEEDYDNKLKSVTDKYERDLKALHAEYEGNIKTLQKENSKLTEKLESIEYELKYVQNMYKEQKQEYEQLLDSATKPDA